MSQKKFKFSFSVFLLIVALVCYFVAGNNLERSNFTLFFLLWAILFLGYSYFISARLRPNLVHTAIGFSIAFRLALLGMLPNLSDDFYRFIWDGRLSAHGINPFSYRPSDLVNTAMAAQSGLDTSLYLLLNSKNYFTVYPPVLQFIFYVATLISPSSIAGAVVCMRLFILAAEAGSMLLIGRLLKRMNLPPQNILIYALNPLVILEGTGNLHFETLMIFFLLLFVYLLLQKKFVAAASAFALAICSKLLPLVFLPLLLRNIGLKKSILFYAVTGLVSAILFILFLDSDFIQNIGSGLQLYFQTFEFNASIFYLLRWTGFQIVGYDTIDFLGRILSLVSLAAIVTISMLRKEKSEKALFEGMLFSLGIYLALSSIVHPWYLCPLLAFSVFTKYKFALFWSALAGLSYAAYENVPVHESFTLLWLEYLSVYSYLVFEIYRSFKAKANSI